ncbi:MAG: MFS transporter [Deltaproteobacteria bacterium]|jgi:sugar phosphate permease|nr:MFS transporter [Deltaproteobacteria bacterium]
MSSLSVLVGRHRAWWLYVIMAAATLIACFQQAGLATVSASIAASLKVEPASLGLLTAAFFYAYAAMQLPAGLLSDGLGPRKSVTMALFLAAVGTVVFALAESLGLATAGRALMGAGLAVIVAPQLKLIAVWFPASAFSRLTAMAFAVTSFGPLMATSPMAYASAAFGWRAPFLLLAGLTLACAGLVWLIVRDGPSRPGRPDQAAGTGRAPAAGRQGAAHPEALRRKLASLVKNRSLWLLGFWQGCQGGGYFAFLALWGGQYLTQGLGLEPAEAGWILTPSACALLAGPLVSLAADKFSCRRTMIGLSACNALLMLPVFLGLPEPFTKSDWAGPALAVYFLIFSIAAMGGAAMIFSAAKELFDVSLAGTVSGFINMFAFAGAAVLQQGMGLLVEYALNGGAAPFEAQSRAYGFFLGAALFSLFLALRYKAPRI